MSALLIRLVSFGLVLGLLPNTVVPKVVRFSLIVSFCIFLIPISAGSISSAQFVEQISFSSGDLQERYLALHSFFPGWRIALREIGIGMLLGVSISTAAYAAEITAGWLTNILLGGFRSQQDTHIDSELEKLASAQAVLLLVFCYVLFHQFDFSKLYLFVGAFNANFSSSAQAPEGTLQVMFSGTLMPIAKLAFSSALLFAIPLFVATLFVRSSAFLFERYLGRSMDSQMVSAAAFPLVVLVMSFGLYAYAEELSRLLIQASDSAAATQLPETIKGFFGVFAFPAA